MARPLRIAYEGAVYHVTSRGNARQDIFLVDSDRKAFVDLLGDTVNRFTWICHAYCLMTNHYHLLVETPEANLSHGMRHLNSVYTQAFNRRHMRCGHVLQGRFKAIVVEKDAYLLELVRYVVLNPVRAEAVRSARDWPWSSYRATAGMEQAPGFLTTSWILRQFHRTPERAMKLYRDFVKQGREVEAWSDLRGGILLGTDGFVDKLRPLLTDYEALREIPRRERLATHPSLDELFADVHTKEDRDRKIHAAVRAHQYTLQAVADFLGLCRSTISIIARRVEAKAGYEEWRSDPAR
ncbi:MAG: transposase [Candidatus Bipolaricaulis sp.]|nr:transposase [Candidatus Bipolaricaulis sp.]